MAHTHLGRIRASKGITWEALIRLFSCVLVLFQENAAGSFAKDFPLPDIETYTF